jgi:hypothetical protein
MELINVDRIAAQVFQGFLEASQNVLSGEDVGEFGARLRGPNAVLGRHLAGNDNVIGISEGALQQPLTVTLTIGQSCIKEIYARITRGVERLERQLILGTDPFTLSNAPGTITDFTNFESRTA